MPASVGMVVLSEGTDIAFGSTTRLKPNCSEIYGLTYRVCDSVAIPRKTNCVKNTYLRVIIVIIIIIIIEFKK